MANHASHINESATAATESPAEKIAEESKLQEPTWDVELKLSDLDNIQDPESLYSITTFDELSLSPNILQGVVKKGFKKPSKVQARALPLMLANPPRNMIAQSQSGTGKTAAFVLTALSRVNLSNPAQPQALILAPSRELARQIESVVKDLGSFCDGLQVQVAVPGMVSRETGVKASVVVGTPGTVMDTIRRQQFDTSKLKVLIVDEADNMLDQQGLGDQCVRVRNMLPTDLQVLLFSATFPEKVIHYAERYAPNAHQMRLRQQELTVKGIQQMYMDCPDEQQKYDILCKLYGLMTIGSSIIFVKSRDSASEIQQLMEADGHKVSVLHGAHEGQNRDVVLEEFRSGRSKVLITTNVLARGIDVSSVSMVINYDVPMKGSRGGEPDHETYLHRIGRTGRFGRVGVSITFVYDRTSFKGMTEIAQHFGIDLVRLTPDDWDSTEKQVQQVLKSARAQADFIPAEKSVQG